MTTTTLSDLYRAKVNIWVEDPVTRSVLTDLWRDTEINVIITHGKPGVLHMVRSAEKAGRSNIFGIVDRDFDEDNESEWERPECDVLRLPVHEMENLLLDFEVLAALSGRATAAEIRADAHANATTLLFWMVCKRALREMQSDLGSGFPTDPPASGALRSLNEVEQYIGRTGYIASRDSAVKRWSPGAGLTGLLQRWHGKFSGHLLQDAWARSFSGKEILRHLRGHIAGLDDTPARPPQPSSADRDHNLAKRIARKMREISRVPPAVLKLRQVLRARAGLR